MCNGRTASMSAGVVVIIVSASVALFSQGQPTKPGRQFLANNPRSNALVTDGDRGATYHHMEQQARRVTTTFTDAVTVADRTPDGQLATTLIDRAGREQATLRVRPIDAANDTLEFKTAEDGPRAAPMRALRRPTLRPTLDWSSAQAYSLWKDRAAIRGTAPALEWHDSILRPAGATSRDAKSEIVIIDTEYRDGLSATVTHQILTHVSYLTNKPTTGLVYISRFKQDGLEIGQSQWWPAEQAFAWSFPGLTDGVITAARLAHNGGWTFTPDMAWLNTQNWAFFQFAVQLKTTGKVSKNREQPRHWFGRLRQFLAPTVIANDAGCDTMHYLDGTLFRFCCDDHDACYYKEDPDCSWASWWQFWKNWDCTECNIGAWFCFITISGSHVYYRFP